MTIDHRGRYGPHAPDVTYVAHAFPEQLVDLGEVRDELRHRRRPRRSRRCCCIPGQTESWWGYEAAMPRLAEHFEVFAVDLRGQGRSTRTPGSLHARQHGQRPRPLHRRGDRPARRS